MPAVRGADGVFRWDAPLSPVRREWVDHYRHMNMGFYLVAFDAQTDRLWPEIALGRSLDAHGVGTFAAEAWLDYQREALEGQELGAESEVLLFDEKRLLLRHRLFHWAEGWTSSEHEVLYLCVDLAARRVSRWPRHVLARFAEVATGREGLRLALRRRA